MNETPSVVTGDAPPNDGDRRGLFVDGSALARREHDVPVLVIHGHAVHATPKQARLLAELYQYLGQVVSYERLCRMLGYQSATSAHVHTIQQYIGSINKMLAEHNAPYVVAVARDLGYALCEVAEGEGAAQHDGLSRPSDAKPL